VRRTAQRFQHTSVHENGHFVRGKAQELGGLLRRQAARWTFQIQEPFYVLLHSSYYILIPWLPKWVILSVCELLYQKFSWPKPPRTAEQVAA